jgi:hypothetical protein
VTFTAARSLELKNFHSVLYSMCALHDNVGEKFLRFGVHRKKSYLIFKTYFFSSHLTNRNINSVFMFPDCRGLCIVVSNALILEGGGFMYW